MRRPWRGRWANFFKKNFRNQVAPIIYLYNIIIIRWRTKTFTSHTLGMLIYVTLKCTALLPARLTTPRHRRTPVALETSLLRQTHNNNNNNIIMYYYNVTCRISDREICPKKFRLGRGLLQRAVLLYYIPNHVESIRILTHWRRTAADSRNWFRPTLTHIIIYNNNIKIEIFTRPLLYCIRQHNNNIIIYNNVLCSAARVILTILQCRFEIYIYIAAIHVRGVIVCT